LILSRFVRYHELESSAEMMAMGLKFFRSFWQNVRFSGRIVLLANYILFYQKYTGYVDE
jgi:hypothetical protein